MHTTSVSLEPELYESSKRSWGAGKHTPRFSSYVRALIIADLVKAGMWDPAAGKAKTPPKPGRSKSSQTGA